MSRRTLETPSFWLLCLALLIVAGTFGFPQRYTNGERLALAALQALLIIALGWASGMRRIAGGNDRHRKMIVTSVLLMWPEATFALMPGFGPPDFADPALNSIRFTVLLVDVVVIGAGSYLLQDLLAEAGETLWSKLAFGAMVSASPAYLIWGTLMPSSYRLAALGTPWHLGPDARVPVQSIVDILQFLGGFLTYLAGALLAVSLNTSRLIGRKTAWILVAVGVFAMACMLARGIDNPPLSLLPSQAFALVGWAAGIPAVPWMILCVIGLLLMRSPSSYQAPNSG